MYTQRPTGGALARSHGYPALSATAPKTEQFRQRSDSGCQLVRGHFEQRHQSDDEPGNGIDQCDDDKRPGSGRKEPLQFGHGESTPLGLIPAAAKARESGSPIPVWQ